MNFYNMLFGMNAQTDLLLAVIGLRKCDIERLRDASANENGSEISVYTRTGGGNREGYPNLAMRKLPGWSGSSDDDFDSTYCTDTFAIPEKWQKDVAGLGDILANGLRKPFANLLAKTLRREPTEDDKATAAYEAERAALARTKHVMANGHTFVPYDDVAMEAALKLAEANDGKMRSCWGILPINLNVRQNYYRYPKATSDDMRDSMERVSVEYDFGWTIDMDYWAHCQKRFGGKYPITMAKIAESVEQHTKKAAA